MPQSVQHPKKQGTLGLYCYRCHIITERLQQLYSLVQAPGAILSSVTVDQMLSPSTCPSQLSDSAPFLPMMPTRYTMQTNQTSSQSSHY